MKINALIVLGFCSLSWNYGNMARVKKLFVYGAIVFLFNLLVVLFWNSLSSQDEEYSEPLSFSSTYNPNSSNNALLKIPRRIFQTVSRHEDYINRPRIKRAIDSIKNFVQEHNLRCDLNDKLCFFEHTVLSDTERDDWVEAHYPEYDEFNRNITYGVQQTDFWRYLVTYHYGGWYIDSDVEIRQPIDEWFTLNQTNGKYIHMLVGIEGDRSSGKYYNQHTRSWLRQQILTWTVGGIPRHPFLRHMIDRMLLKKHTPKNPANFEYVVGDFAGPQELTRNVNSYIINATNGTMNLVKVFARGGNVLVADNMFVAEVNAFSCQNFWSIGISGFSFFIKFKKIEYD